MKFFRKLSGKSPKPTTLDRHESSFGRHAKVLQCELLLGVNRPCIAPHSNSPTRAGATPAPKPPPRSLTDGNALLNALGSRDLGSSTRAAEQLYTMCLTDPGLCRLVAASHLGSVVRLLESPYPNCKMHGAYLLSALVGCSPSGDAEMARLEIAPRLVHILGSSASPASPAACCAPCPRCWGRIRASRTGSWTR